MSVRPHLIFRAENHDAAFVNWLPLADRPFDGVVVPAKYLADYVEPSGVDPNALPDALVAKQIPLLVDPATPELALPSVKRRANARLLESRIGKALPLPVELAHIVEKEEVRNRLVERALAAGQRGNALVPPYFEYQCREHGELQANIAMFTRARSSAGSKPLVAFVQATEAAFRAGVLPALAEAYAEADVKRVFVRVRGLRNEEMDAAAFRSYLEVITAFRQANIRVTIDCAGRAGPPLVAGGARGFATGWRPSGTLRKSRLAAGGTEASRHAMRSSDASLTCLSSSLRSSTCSAGSKAAKHICLAQSTCAFSGCGCTSCTSCGQRPISQQSGGRSTTPSD
jgi:hypothetical protein